MRTPLVAVLILCLVALGVFVVLQLQDPADVAEPGDPNQELGAEGRTQGERGGGPGGMLTDEPNEAATDTSTTNIRTGITITVRGTCVDSQGAQAVPGCEVVLDWGRRVRGTTDRDGRFQLAFDPYRTVNFNLTITPPAGVTMHTERLGVAPGSVIDVGTVVILPGCRLRGVVVDRKDQPVSGVGVTLRGDFVAKKVQPLWTLSTISASDGSVKFPPLPAGEHRVEIGAPELLHEPRQLIIEAGRPERYQRFVVENRVGELAGFVHDERDRPVAGARVTVEPRRELWRGVVTDKRGAFHLPRHAGDSSQPVKLLVRKDGYEDFASTRRYPIDSRDIRVVLKVGTGLTIRVTGADTKRPVEDFGVWLLQQSWSKGLEDYKPRFGELAHKGQHKEGRLWIPGLANGFHYLRVVPADRSLGQVGVLRHQITDDPATRVVQVALFRKVQRTLQVQSSMGMPVSGTKVELVRRVFADRSVELEDLAVDNLRVLYPEAHWLEQNGITNGSGRWQMRGAPADDYVLRIKGAGHPPKLVPSVRLAAGMAPLIVEVGAGASIQGTLLPPEILKEFEPPGRKLQIYGDSRLGVVLVRARDQQTFPLESHRSLPLNAKGQFQADGVPPGDWVVHLRCVSVIDKQFVFPHLEPIGEVKGLADRERRNTVYDLTPLRPARVSGTVLLDGQPFRGGRVLLNGSRSRGKQVLVRQLFPLRAATADQGGQFQVPVLQGEYRIGITLHDPAWSGEGRDLYLRQRFRIQPGAQLHQTFEFRRRRARVRVLDGGRPAARRRFELASDQPVHMELVTDNNGWCVVDPAPYGSFSLHSWPRRLATRKQRQAYAKKHRRPPAPAAVGPMSVPPNRSEWEFQLRLRKPR